MAEKTIAQRVADKLAHRTKLPPRPEMHVPLVRKAKDKQTVEVVHVQAHDSNPARS